MKKITVRIIGGLGNQLHGYAFGRALATQNQAILELDTDSGFWNDPYKREYLLNVFSDINIIRRPFINVNKYSILLFKIKIKFISFCSGIFPIKYKLFVEEPVPFRYRSEIHRASYVSNPYFAGYWASYRYYKDIEKELRKEIKPPMPTDVPTLELLNQIQAANSCFIHWRSYNEEKGVERPILLAYYINAINYISAKHPDVVFFVFSDDPAGARSQIKFPGRKLIYVDLSSTKENLQSLADFYLMYRCNHAIIGDSSFSWWAAWLNEREGKTVVAPRGLSPWGEDWIPPQWIALDVNSSKE